MMSSGYWAGWSIGLFFGLVIVVLLAMTGVSGATMFWISVVLGALFTQVGGAIGVAVQEERRNGN